MEFGRPGVLLQSLLTMGEAGRRITTEAAMALAYHAHGVFRAMVAKDGIIMSENPKEFAGVTVSATV